ncbi:Tf2-9, partial [Mucuna pruriens]
MRSPKSVKEVQQLVGRITALSHFLSRSTEKSAPIFQRLQKAERFKWTDDYEVSFQELKAMLATPPILTLPVVGKPIYLYISMSNTTVSSVIVQEGEGEQRSMYYINKALQGKIEKVTLAIINTVRRLRSYFQSHPVVCRTDLLI